MASDEVLHKDVVIALLGATAALVGLILVFVGLAVGAYGALAGDTPQRIKARLRRRTCRCRILDFTGAGVGLTAAVELSLNDAGLIDFYNRRIPAL